ncbi:NB-ARC - like 10 [Theobroma cacao]|nr:NB-ARC - like 10 [Theobroma cacao]
MYHRVVTQKNDLHLRENDVGRPKRKIERPPTTSLVNEAPVYGREEDKKAIIDLLLMNDYSDDKVIVIPIVGIGGIGKTTLAQLVYNDDSIKDHFDIKVWCNEVNDLNLLQVELKEKLYENNFLLVLDDIWNGRYHDWNILQFPLEVGGLRSKIIVTTRDQNVSSIMRTVPNHSLKELPNDDCLFILTQHSLGEKALWLSYYNLPTHLKQCFSYCSILPKAYEFEEEEIVLLWMAEGLL